MLFVDTCTHPSRLVLISKIENRKLKIALLGHHIIVYIAACIPSSSNCPGIQGNNGCSGGNMFNSFMYIIDNEGIATSSAYPYQAIVRLDYISALFSPILIK